MDVKEHEDKFIDGELYVHVSEYYQIYDEVVKTTQQNVNLQKIIDSQNKELTRLRRLERRQQNRWRTTNKNTK
ncbi:hypothetical protein HOBO_34 [Bacillus phage Hobo]|uniref:Uncharacterized protein n=2 Tax=Caeruleovirus BM15 TaxID=1985178 RepID=A0A0S2MU89_9CAUD|nr:hypothetical protein FD732_gp034 [Bacillus phage BM15]ALO79455.1 hypothetical protein BM10_34 [Bacillus phage BM15]AXQ66815.1 hypothetical protein HOBO_34 [Bacillus phage Hobo]